MELSEEQRQAIGKNCLSTSWQQLTPWRLQHLGSATDEPQLMADWLANAHPDSQAQAEEIVRWISERLWRLEMHPEPLGRSADSQTGLYALQVVCSGLRWTLWLMPKPQLHLHRLSRASCV